MVEGLGLKLGQTILYPCLQSCEPTMNVESLHLIQTVKVEDVKSISGYEVA